MIPRAPLQLHPARGFLDRLKGLTFNPPIDSNRGLWLPDCYCVHTLTLTFSIDLVFLGQALEPLRVEQSVGPGRILFCRAACSVVELQAGYVLGNTYFAENIKTAVQQILADSARRY